MGKKSPKFLISDQEGKIAIKVKSINVWPAQHVQTGQI